MFNNTNNTNKTNISFKSVSGIMIKTHPKTRIEWCDWQSPFYKNLDERRILQMILITDTRMCIEYVDDLSILDEIFFKEERQ